MAMDRTQEVRAGIVSLVEARIPPLLVLQVVMEGVHVVEEVLVVEGVEGVEGVEAVEVVGTKVAIKITVEIGAAHHLMMRETINRRKRTRVRVTVGWAQARVMNYHQHISSSHLLMHLMQK